MQGYIITGRRLRGKKVFLIVEFVTSLIIQHRQTFQKIKSTALRTLETWEVIQKISINVLLFYRSCKKKTDVINNKIKAYCSRSVGTLLHHSNVTHTWR